MDIKDIILFIVSIVTAYLSLFIVRGKNASINKSLIILTPSDSFGATSILRLKKFYKRFGFVENKGRNKDFQLSCGMYRKP